MKKILFFVCFMLSLSCAGQEQMVENTEFGMIYGNYDLYTQTYSDYFLKVFPDTNERFMLSTIKMTDTHIVIENSQAGSLIPSMSKYKEKYDFECGVSFLFHFADKTRKEILVDNATNFQEGGSYFLKTYLTLRYDDIDNGFIGYCKKAKSLSIKYWDRFFSKECVMNVSLSGFTKTFEKYLSLCK